MDTTAYGGRLPHRRYPIRCLECGKKQVRRATESQQVKRNYEGRVYELAISDLPITRCDACGATYLTQESDERILAALRQQMFEQKVRAQSLEPEDNHLGGV